MKEYIIVAKTLTIYYLSSSLSLLLFKFSSVVRNIVMRKGFGTCKEKNYDMMGIYVFELLEYCVYATTIRCHGQLFLLSWYSLTQS